MHDTDRPEKKLKKKGELRARERQIVSDTPDEGFDTWETRVEHHEEEGPNLRIQWNHPLGEQKSLFLEVHNWVWSELEEDRRFL